jgi:phenylpyruvate tautomerase PptA (4-oxalocrotonate tautomerase family)
MSQVKIYGVASRLNAIKARLSDIIHGCVMEAFAYPADKRAHRFFPLEKEDFYYPAGRSDAYTIIEISLFEGRTVEAKKRLYRLLFDRIQAELGISPIDVEITLFETPRHNWGIRGVPGDELAIDYKVEV